MNEIFIKPCECSKNEINQFYAMIKKNENINNIGLKKRIMKAKILIFHYEEEKLAGIGALKYPDPNYMKKVFKSAGVSHLYNSFKYEIGYLYVDNKYRKKGISKSITENLLSFIDEDNIFAVVRSDNKFAKNNLYYYGFVKIGSKYIGKDNYFELFALFQDINK